MEEPDFFSSKKCCTHLQARYISLEEMTEKECRNALQNHAKENTTCGRAKAAQQVKEKWKWMYYIAVYFLMQTLKKDCLF